MEYHLFVPLGARGRKQEAWKCFTFFEICSIERKGGRIIVSSCEKHPSSLSFSSRRFVLRDKRRRI